MRDGDVSFAPPLPLSRHRHGIHTSKCLLRTTNMTADPPTKTQLPASSPIQPSPEIFTTALTTSLHSIFSLKQPPSTLPLSPTTVWHTPLFDLSSEEIPTLVSSFLSFAVDPCLSIHTVNPQSCTFSWTLSFNYPLPWRPRVSIAGTTTADNLTAPTVITDSWLVSPFTLIKQALPRIPDIIWLYPGPHAENDEGLRRVLRKRKKRYRLELFACREEVRVVGETKIFEKELMFASPALPDAAFQGGLRRREMYSTISPIGVRELDGDVVEWAVQVPSMFTGSAELLLPRPEGEGVRVEKVSERVMAVVRFGGFAMREIVKEKVEKLLSDLKSDGISGIGRERIWVRVYDSKVGFNSKGLLAMAMYGSSTGIPRLNEIAIDVTDLVDQDLRNER